MGHVRLGLLPKSKKWLHVVNGLALGADAEAVAVAATEAAEASLRRAAADPIFLHTFWLLTQLPLAARGPEFTKDLRNLGLALDDVPTLFGVIAGFRSAIDNFSQSSGGRSDLGEMAQMPAVESLVATELVPEFQTAC